MRDHSTRGYNKSKVTRYRTKSKFLADSHIKIDHYKVQIQKPVLKLEKKYNPTAN